MSGAAERAGRWEGHQSPGLGAEPGGSASRSLNSAGAVVEVFVDGTPIAVGHVFRDVDEQWLVKYGARRRLRVFRIDPRGDGHVARCEDLNCAGTTPYFPAEQLADPTRFARCPELEKSPPTDERSAA